MNHQEYIQFYPNHHIAGNDIICGKNTSLLFHHTGLTYRRTRIELKLELVGFTPPFLEPVVRSYFWQMFDSKIHKIRQPNP